MYERKQSEPKFPEFTSANQFCLYVVWRSSYSNVFSESYVTTLPDCNVLMFTTWHRFPIPSCEHGWSIVYRWYWASCSAPWPQTCCLAHTRSSILRPLTDEYVLFLMHVLRFPGYKFSIVSVREIVLDNPLVFCRPHVIGHWVFS